MPFTPTHVVAVLPFSYWAGRRLAFSALAIGSMIPDLPLFIPFLQLDYAQTHSITGIFAACLPAGFLTFLWFELFAKRPLFALCPRWVRQRLVPYEQPAVTASFGSVIMAAFSIVIGAATHVFWDSFTHYGRWGYRLFPRMNRIIFENGDYSLELYKAIQHGSTVVGLPLLLVVAALWLRRQQAQLLEDRVSLTREQLVIWLLVLFVLPNVLALAYCATQSFESLGQFAFTAVTTAGFVFLLVLNLYAFWFRR